MGERIKQNDPRHTVTVAVIALRVAEEQGIPPAEALAAVLQRAYPDGAHANNTGRLQLIQGGRNQKR